MTTYLGEKPVGIGTIKATETVGKVITDKATILGDGFTDPLKVNTLLFATSESVAASAEAIRTEVNNKFTVVDSAIKGANEAIEKTREDYIQADSEIHQMLNGLSAETTTIKNNQASLGTQVANIEHKIPDGTTGTNSLINKQILAQTSYTKAEVDAKVSSVYKFKGSVSTYNSLPSTATTGDVYNVTDTGANYAWDGSKWDKLSETIDLTAYATTAYVTAREQDIRSDLGENISEVHTQVVGLSGEVAKKLNSDGDTMTGTLNVPELNVATPEGTLNLSITAGVATIATNNGLDIVSQTKFDKAPTTDDATAWADVNPTALVTKQQVATAVSEAGGGGASLPDQTGNGGKFLTTDGTTTSWGDALVNNSTATNALAVGGATADNYGVALGYDASTHIFTVSVGAFSYSSAAQTVAVGGNARATAESTIAIGYAARASAIGAIQLGTNGKNNDANTFKVANKNGNFEMMSADGTIPLERLTKVTDQIGDISTALTAILGE